MPGSAFKGRTVKSAPGKGPKQAPEKAASSAAEKRMFAKEMHFQVYRIENVLKITDADVLRDFARTNPDLLKQPALIRFFEAYQGNRTNEFIEQAKAKSRLEREKLLDGIRRVIFKAKISKQEYAKARIKAEKKAKTQEEREIAKMHEMLQRKLTKEDIDKIETNLAVPMTFNPKKFNLSKIQYRYMSIIAGQKVIGSYVNGMQKEYSGVIKKYQENAKKYSSYTGWRKYAGIVDYGLRKGKSAFGWLKKGFNWIRGKKSPSPKTASDKINDAIAKVRKSFKEKLDRVKNLKERVKARSNELKKGLGVHKSGIRERLKTLISREDWTKAKKLQHEQTKALLKKQKDQLGQKLLAARTKEAEIEKSRRGTVALSGSLRNKYRLIKTGEKSLDDRIKSVKSRLAQLEKMYGRKDPRVVHIRTKVLVPLLQGQDRMAQIKEGTAAGLNTVEEKNQKLDILKADMYLGETSLVEQIEKTELRVTSESKKIDVLSKNRMELQKLLEGMETAYVAVSEFKSSVGKNLDKMVEGNKKVVTGLGKQYDVLGKIKASEPGLLTSLYNTVGIGQFGILGLGELAFQHPTRFIGWVGKNVYNLFSGGEYFEYSKTKKWHIGTGVNWLCEKYDKYIYGGLKKLNKGTDNWFLKGFTFGAGVLKAGLGLVNGVVTLVVDTETVVKSLDLILSDWGEFKRMLKGVVHYDEWSESAAGAAGQTAGDLIIMFFTAGAGKGASAAKTAAAIGKSSKLAYAAAFSKEILRQSINTVIKAVKFPFSVLGALKSGTAGLLKKTLAFAKGSFKGEGLSQIKAVSQEIIERNMANVGGDISKMAERLLQSKTVISEPVKDLLKKIGDKGVKGLTRAELGILQKGLAKELSRISGWRTSNLVERLGSATGKYSRLVTKMEKLTGKVVGTADAVTVVPKVDLSDVAKQVLEGGPQGALATLALKRRLGKYLESLFRKRQSLVENLKTLKKTIDDLKVKIAKNKGKKYSNHVEEYLKKQLSDALAKKETMRQEIRAVSKEFVTLKSKLTELRVFRYENLKAGVSNVYKKVIASIKNIKLKPPELVKTVASRIIEIAKWPVWLPTMYARVLYKMNPARARAILSKRGLEFGKRVDEVTGIVALGEVSKRINKALLRGRIKEALKLYYGSRSLAKEAGIAFNVMDKSFLGYLHKVAPITVKKINDIKQLQDLSFIDSLPEKIPVKASVMKQFEARAEKELAELIKSKPIPNKK